MNYTITSVAERMERPGDGQLFNLEYMSPDPRSPLYASQNMTEN